MSERERRGLVPLEVAMVLAIALIPWPEMLPLGIPLVVAGSIARWLRGRSWAEVWGAGASSGAGVGMSAGRQASIGAVVGVVALGLAVALGTPVVETLGTRAVEWSRFPIVRGSGSQAMTALVLVSINALAMELALRGWLVERVLELSPGPALLPVLLGAFAEALITPGDAAVRIGAGLFGIGLGWMYVAGGRNISAPVAARVAFAAGAVMLEAMKAIG